MKGVKILMCFVLAYLAIGCSCTKPMPKFYYGSAIEQNDAEKTVINYLQRVLYDPYSARLRFGNVYQGYFQTTPTTGCKVYYGYVLNVGVNAKNRYGGYVGEKLYTFVFYDQRIIYVNNPR